LRLPVLIAVQSIRFGLQTRRQPLGRRSVEQGAGRRPMNGHRPSAGPCYDPVSSRGRGIGGPTFQTALHHRDGPRRTGAPNRAPTTAQAIFQTDGGRAGRFSDSVSRWERLMVISFAEQQTPKPHKAAMSKAPAGVMRT